ncbi:MAG: diguanylate cyclase [Candidatus Neomarinimicrobiota bacterium]
MKRKSILIVDDEPTHRLLVEKILKEYDVTHADSGRQMWELLNENKPSIILMDVMMPEVDGFQLLNNLCANEETKDIPVLFLSARDDGNDVELGLGLGGYDYIKKPFNQLELKARIKSALNRKETEDELKMLSMLDSLTSLYNRRYFDNSFEKQLSYVCRNHLNLSIGIMDLDEFKLINDRHGHQAGDFIIRSFADKMKQSVRKYDIVARFGGEEFIIMFFDCGKAMAKTIMDRIKDEIAQSSYEYNSDKIKFTFSGGISELADVDSDTITAEQLISIADRRLYSAKQDGRNRIYA